MGNVDIIPLIFPNVLTISFGEIKGKMSTLPINLLIVTISFGEIKGKMSTLPINLSIISFGEIKGKISTSNVDIFPFIYPNDIVSNVDIFPLISPNDIVTINKLTLILKIIGPSEVKHIMAFYFKNGSC
jgi:hypothetical protein